MMVAAVGEAEVAVPVEPGSTGPVVWVCICKSLAGAVAVVEAGIGAAALQ